MRIDTIHARAAAIAAAAAIAVGCESGPTQMEVTVDPFRCEDNEFRIAFQRTNSLFGDGPSIYVARGDGTGVTRLAPGSHPAWSWDGCRIAFTRNLNIMVMNADGSGEKSLGQGRRPYWMPGTPRIVFVRGGPADGGIYMVDPDGTAGSYLAHRFWEAEEGVDGTCYHYESAVPSPNGQSLALIRSLALLCHAGWVLWEAHVFRGGDPEPTLVWPGGQHVAWSPDGSRLAMSGGFGWPWVIGSTASDGSDSRVHTNHGHFPDWSPDGTRILFAREGRIFTVDVETGAERLLIADVGELDHDSYAVWSRALTAAGSRPPPG
jgi:Tol biopolymer transport system component